MSPAYPLDAAHLVAFLEACLDSGKWPDEEAPAHPPGAVWPWAEEVHACNARLRREAGEGHAEDIAAFETKRAEAIRRIDAAVADWRGTRGAPAAAESVGALADRLSRLALDLRARAGPQAARERGELARRLDAALGLRPP